MVLVIVFWWLSPGIVSIIVVIIISQLISHVAYLFFARHDLWSWWQFYKFDSRFSIWQIIKSYGRWSIFTNVLASLLSNGRNYIIKFLISTEAVAIWSVALSMTSLLYSLIPSDKILSIFLPYKIKFGDLKVEYYRLYTKYLTVAYASLMIIGWIGATIVITVFFPSYKASLHLFYMMSLVSILSGVNDFVASYLHTLRHQKVIFYRTLQKNILAVTFMVLFVSLFGYIGLAFEYLLTTTYLVIFSYFSLVRLHPELRLTRANFSFSKSEWHYLVGKISDMISGLRSSNHS